MRDQIGGASVPEVSSALNADYAFTLFNVPASVGATWNYVGKRNAEFSTAPAVLSNNARLPAYDTIDLRAGVELERFRIDALVRNLTDEAGIVLYRNAGGFDATSGTGVITQPRTIALRLSAQF